MKTGSVPAWLVITTVLSAVMGMGSLVLLLFVPMLFDNPSAVNNPATVSLASSIVLFPVCCLLGIVFSWWSFRKGRVKQAVVMALIPLLPALTTLLSITALQVFYGGNFGG